MSVIDVERLFTPAITYTMSVYILEKVVSYDPKEKDIDSSNHVEVTEAEVDQPPKKINEKILLRWKASKHIWYTWCQS